MSDVELPCEIRLLMAEKKYWGKGGVLEKAKELFKDENSIKQCRIWIYIYKEAERHADYENQRLKKWSYNKMVSSYKKILKKLTAKNQG